MSDPSSHGARPGAADTGHPGAGSSDAGSPEAAALRTELEAAAFRALRDHLAAHPEVQNIDLMNLAGFCRNCLSRWYQEAAEARGQAMDKETARTIVYGMPYDEWKARHQSEATPDAAASFAARPPENSA